MVKVEDIHHVVLRVPDLALAERFMSDFGLVTARKSASRLYMRAAGAEPYCYVAEEGAAPELVAIAFSVGSMELLRQAAREASAAGIEAIDAPGGGHRVTLRDPDGIRIDLVTGIGKAQPLEVRAPLVLNSGTQKTRKGIRQVWLNPAPATILRLGHAGLLITNFQRSLDWYTSTLGLLPSDVLYVQERSRPMAAFLRADRGDEWVDHHVLALFAGPVAKFQHASFEAQDFDAQQLGRGWMESRGWKPYWGIGRQALGSHIFDSFFDPFGFRMENFSDTDLLSRSSPAQYRDVKDANVRWGPGVPADVSR